MDWMKEEDRKLAEMKERWERLKKSTLYRAAKFLGKTTWATECYHRQLRKKAAAKEKEKPSRVNRRFVKFRQNQKINFDVKLERRSRSVPIRYYIEKRLKYARQKAFLRKMKISS